jgi:hypothetical protein
MRRRSSYGHGWYKPARAGPASCWTRRRTPLNDCSCSSRRYRSCRPSLYQRSARTCERAYSLANRYPPGSPARRSPHRAGPAGTGQPERLDAGHLGVSRTCRAVRFLGLPAAGRGRSGTAQRSPTRWNSTGTGARTREGLLPGLPLSSPLTLRCSLSSPRWRSRRCPPSWSARLPQRCSAAWCPSALPAAGGLEIAARYVPGTGIWEAASMTCSASRRAR